MNKVEQGCKEVSAFIVTTLLSCGVSQIFGAVKLIMDTGSLLSEFAKRYKIEREITLACEGQQIDRIDRIAERLKIKKEELSTERIGQYLQAAQEKRKDKINRLYRSLKADLCALIPLVGAHLSWRVATGYKGKSCVPFVSRGIQHLFENVPHLASKPFFWNSNQEVKDDPAIAVQTALKTRWLTPHIYYPKGFGFENRAEAFRTCPTVVLFHHQSGTAANMRAEAEMYTQLGFCALAVTIGGYPGSPGVKTSEASICQDIEAIKQYLKKQGVTKVAWHGKSMGSGLALHAAADENPEGLKTLFVVADKPYNSVKGVGSNVAGPFGKGFLKAGLPSKQSVELPGGRKIKTDGFNNLKKAKKLQEKEIPLFCIMGKGSKDFFMSYQNGSRNFARDVLEKRYQDQDVQVAHLIQGNRGHGSDELEGLELAKKLYSQHLLPDTGKKVMEEKFLVDEPAWRDIADLYSPDRNNTTI